MVNSNERRKGDGDRRKKEQRRNWALTFELRDDNWWKIEELNGRRRKSNDQRQGALNRRKADRRKRVQRSGGERRKSERRGGVYIRRPGMTPRETPAQVAEARAALGGVKRERPKLISPAKLAEPTPIYKPPSLSPTSLRQGSEEIEPSVFEAAFPGWKESFRSAATSVRNLFRRG